MIECGASEDCKDCNEFEPKIKGQITTAINDKLQPIVKKLAQENAKKVFDVIVTPVSAIYIGAVKGFAAGFPNERGIMWRCGSVGEG